MSNHSIIGLSTADGQITVGLKIHDLGIVNAIEKVAAERPFYRVFMNMSFNEVLVDSAMGGPALFRMEIPASQVTCVLEVSDEYKDRVLQLHQNIINKVTAENHKKEREHAKAMKEFQSRGGILPQMLNDVDEDRN